MATVVEVEEGGVARKEDAGAALRELFDAHGGAVYGLCAVLLGDRTEAEDATQQAFLSAYESLLRGAVPWSPAAWLAAIARNECRDRLRAQARRTVPTTEQEPASVTLEEVATLNAEFLALRHALRELPERQREAILLFELCGLSYGEIAGVLNMSHAAVETLLFRTRKRLRKRVGALPLVPGILGAPLVIGEELAHAVPGFGAAGQASAAVASAAAGGMAGGTAGGGSFAGVAFVKFAALPLVGKVAAIAATAGVATTMVVGIPGRSPGMDARASGTAAQTVDPFSAGFASPPLQGDSAVEAGALPAFPVFDSHEVSLGDPASAGGSVDAGNFAGEHPVPYAGSSRETGPSDEGSGPAGEGTSPGDLPGPAEDAGGDSDVDSAGGSIENGNGDDPPVSGPNPGEGSSGEPNAGGGGGGNGGSGDNEEPDPPGGGNGNGGGGSGDDPPSGGGDDPPAGGGDDPPAGGGDDPPAGGGDDPPAGGGDDPPAGGGDDPPAGGGDDPPAGGGDDPPPGGGGDPPSGDDGSGADDGDEVEEADPPGDDDGPKKPKKPKKPKV